MNRSSKAYDWMGQESYLQENIHEIKYWKEIFLIIIFLKSTVPYECFSQFYVLPQHTFSRMSVMISVVFDMSFSGSSWPETVMASTHRPTAAAAANETRTTDVMILISLDKVILIAVSTIITVHISVAKLRCCFYYNATEINDLFLSVWKNEKKNRIIIIIINDYLHKPVELHYTFMRRDYRYRFIFIKYVCGLK